MGEGEKGRTGRDGGRGGWVRERTGGPGEMEKRDKGKEGRTLTTKKEGETVVVQGQQYGSYNWTRNT